MAPHPYPNPNPSQGLAEEKRALRQVMAERRETMSAVDRRACALAAAGRLLALPQLAVTAGRTVAAYLAIKGEIDPAPALEALGAAGAVVVLPRVSAVPPRLRFHRPDANLALCAGPFGLLEPDAACAEVPVEAIDVMIVPGLAFDAAGRRLGYGGGYYDQVGIQVRAAGQGVLIGLGYDFQVVDRCPAGAGDIALDLVVTERRVLRARGGE
jgi:5-formyltetrahydrofolate cyclo-ligase